MALFNSVTGITKQSDWVILGIKKKQYFFYLKTSFILDYNICACDKSQCFWLFVMHFVKIFLIMKDKLYSDNPDTNYGNAIAMDRNCNSVALSAIWQSLIYHIVIVLVHMQAK